MQFITIMTTTLLTITPVLATPANSFYACTDPQFRGRCYQWNFQNGVCYNFDSTTVNTMSAFRSPSYGQLCILYSKPNCGRSRKMVGMQAGANYPDLYRSEKGNFDNVNKSYKCGARFQAFGTVDGDRENVTG